MTNKIMLDKAVSNNKYNNFVAFKKSKSIDKPATKKKIRYQEIGDIT